MKMRRDYELTVKIGKKMRIFRYKQASAYETMRFMEDVGEDDFNLILWVYWFLNDICETERGFFQKKNISRKEFSVYAMQFDTLHDTIQKTYFFGAFNKKSEDDKEKEDTMPFDAYLTLLAGKLNADPMQILKEYTFEQIGELGAGVVYVMNMGSDEGRKENEKMKLQEKMKMVDKDQVSDTLRRLEEWQKKNQTGNSEHSKDMQIDIENTITRGNN